VDDYTLGDKLAAEAEGILLWALEGLHRLIENGYRFTISERARGNLEAVRRDDNNILSFLESEKDMSCLRKGPMPRPGSCTRLTADGAGTMLKNHWRNGPSPVS